MGICTEEDISNGDINKFECQKIIALSENFSPETIQDIITGNLKNGDVVFIECEEREPEDHETFAVGNSVTEILEDDDLRNLKIH
jgi:hypothetical protein